MSPPIDLGRLTTEEWARVQSWTERLERAWESGTPADLRHFLPPPPDKLRGVVLCEQIKADLELRWRRGRRITLDEYARDFPELGPVEALDAALVYEEYRVRRLYGDRPALAEYQRRFPGRFDELQVLLRQHPVPLPAARSPAAGAPIPGELAPMNDPNYLPIGGGYVLVKKLGSGTFADVYQAEAPGGIAVAIKIVRQPIDHRDAQRELEALRKTQWLNNPFLVNIHAHYLYQERLHVVMDLADCTLLDRLKECRLGDAKGIPAAELVGYFRDAAIGLDYLHDQDLQHRDVKPANILLVKPARHGRPSRGGSSSDIRAYAKLADFGLARLLEGSHQDASMAGTLIYMAPEVWHGQISVHTDQYSLAAVYVELRRDRPLYAGRDMPRLFQEFLKGDQELDLEPLGPAEQEVVRKALAKDYRQRFDSCQAFVSALEAALPVKAPPPPPKREAEYRRLSRRSAFNRGEVWEAVAADGRRLALTLIHNIPWAEAKEDLAALAFLERLRHEHLATPRQHGVLDANGLLLSGAALARLDPATQVTLAIDCELHDTDLGQRLERCRQEARGGVPPEELFAYLRPAAAAVDHLNDAHPQDGKLVSMRHCGLNPEALLLFGSTLKVGDFSQLELVEGRRAPIENADLKVGWAAPEVFNDQAVTDRSDQYAFAVTYYRLRTGDVPFGRHSLNLDLLEGKLDLSHLDPGERKVLARAIAPDPDDRYASCADLVAELERAYRASLVEASPAAAPPATGGAEASTAEEDFGESLYPGAGGVLPEALIVAPPPRAEPTPPAPDVPDHAGGGGSAPGSETTGPDAHRTIPEPRKSTPLLQSTWPVIGPIFPPLPGQLPPAPPVGPSVPEFVPEAIPVEPGWRPRLSFRLPRRISCSVTVAITSLAVLLVLGVVYKTQLNPERRPEAATDGYAAQALLKEVHAKYVVEISRERLGRENKDLPELVAALELAQDLAEHPELKTEAGQCRDKVLIQVRAALQPKLTEAADRKNPATASKSFADAYDSIAWVRGCLAEEGKGLEDEVLSKWVAYGRAQEAAAAKHTVAEAILAKNALCADARQLQQDTADNRN